MNSPYKGKFKISQVYKGLKHKGLDLVGLSSKQLFSTVDAVVDAVGWDPNPLGMGLRLRLKDDKTNNLVYYAHCAKTYVKVGDTVKIGDLVALEGSTGHSTGSHCHYEIRRVTNSGTFIDVNTFSGIPNKLGVYEEEEEMTQEEFNAKMDAYLLNQKKLPPSDWSAKERKWAENIGLIEGDTQGELQYKSPVTREQLTIFMNRLFTIMDSGKMG